MIELRDLRAFVTLGETLHFRRAAERLHLTQSALSKQIQRLEEDFGGPLFERSPSATRLTRLGRALLPEATTLVEGANRLSRRAKAAAQGLVGSLRIGFGVTTKTIAPLAISRFRQLRPDVQISLHEMSTRHQYQAMIDGTLDVGFCRLPAPAGWPTLTAQQDSLLALIPESYPADITPEALVQYPLVTIDRTRAPAFYDHLINFFAQRGLDIASLQTVNAFTSAQALAAAGVGWAIVPGSFGPGGEGVRAIDFADERARWQVGLVRPPGEADALVSLFWEMVADVVAEKP
ncbi:LysR family transcriptional regulator [Niveibacterium sp. SC-1]|uniref:LysR family transcriptional regulator n=1 Tax=Niveibacterium sp. SC-1 TaxID=3135646 RepID=UPI00311F0EF9